MYQLQVQIQIVIMFTMKGLLVVIVFAVFVLTFFGKGCLVPTPCWDLPNPVPDCDPNNSIPARAISTPW